jgi:DNA-binding Lrp family transcriptional regulator
MVAKNQNKAQIDDLDRKILRSLNQDSRKSFRTLARELGTATATIIKRVKDLENAGVIRGYGLDIDYEQLGYDLIAMVELTISKGKLIEVEKEISKIPNVFAVYDLTGTYDAVVLARFKTRRELSSMIKSLLKLEYVERTNTHLILNVIKEGSSLI